MVQNRFRYFIFYNQTWKLLKKVMSILFKCRKWPQILMPSHQKGILYFSTSLDKSLVFRVSVKLANINVKDSWKVFFPPSCEWTTRWWKAGRHHPSWHQADHQTHKSNTSPVLTACQKEWVWGHPRWPAFSWSSIWLQLCKCAQESKAGRLVQLSPAQDADSHNCQILKIVVFKPLHSASGWVI